MPFFQAEEGKVEVYVVTRCLFLHPHFLFKLKAFAECVSLKPLKESDMLLHGKTKIESVR